MDVRVSPPFCPAAYCRSQALVDVGLTFLPPPLIVHLKKLASRRHVGELYTCTRRALCALLATSLTILRRIALC
jgi:hypothetical protein